ncbi:major facilitator superfamily domain-containing protein [Hyaloraphidium curvatum]|nr:major facilitator superfamily domain-containing protein [Hyaloraphidium curvatum]
MPTWFGGESSAGAIRASFYVVASISVVWSVLAFFGLSLGLGFRGRTTPLSGRAEAAGTRAPVANGDSNGVTEGKLAAEAVLPEPVTQEHRQLNIFQSAWLGIKAASDPRVAYGYIGALPARGDTINLTLWLPLFFAYYYFSSGLCPNPDWDVTDPDEVKAVCREAWSKASSMSGVAQVIALIAAVPWGLLCDRISRVAVLLISSCVALVGYAGMVATRDPTRGITYVWACLLGLAETGLIVSSLALVTDRTYIPMEIKGSVAGVYSFMGAVGILITTKVGGVLFDVAARYAWTVGLAFCAICILAGALILGIYRRPVGWRKAAPAPEPAAAQT